MNSRRDDRPKSTISDVTRRDWVLLPLTALATIALLVAVSEMVARSLYPESKGDACYVADGPSGPHYRANCRSRIKAAESPWVDNAYNSCGYRSNDDCGKKPPHSLRIVVMGTSYSYGYLVPYQDTFNAVGARTLSRQCHRHVEFQSNGMLGLPMPDVYLRTDDALSMHPDALLLVVDPRDIASFNDFDPNPASHPAEKEPSTTPSARPGGLRNWIHWHVVEPLKASRAFLLLQHFILQSPATYANMYLGYGNAPDYLRQPFNAGWQHRFANLKEMVALMHQRAEAQGVPMILVVAPSVAQAALVNTPGRVGIYPNAFADQVSRIGTELQVPVINTVPMFAHKPDVMSLFYVVDGHINAKGQQIFASGIDGELLSGRYHAFAGCTSQ